MIDRRRNGRRTIVLKAAAPCPPFSKPHVWHTLVIGADQHYVEAAVADAAYRALWLGSDSPVN